MSTTFFTSDEHYCHSNMIPFCGRPFGNFERFGDIARDDMEEDMLVDYRAELKEATLEMNEHMIDNNNAVVSKGDSVYHLGDFGMGKPSKIAKIFNRLKGTHFLIKGNHDSKHTLKLPWQAVYDCKDIRIDDEYISMYHYPQRSWNRSYHGSIHISGHVHGRCLPWGKSCDIGVDSWDYKPVSFEQLKEFMDKQPMLSEYATDSFTSQGGLWHGPSNSVRGLTNLSEPVSRVL